MRRKNQQRPWVIVADTCGFYDVFTVREAIAWCEGELKPQQVRDALTLMVKHGTLVRVEMGVYRWV